MAFHVRDPETDKAVRRLAQLKGKTLTATIREAVEHEYERDRGHVSLAERVRAIQDHLAAIAGPNGEPADKKFYAALSGES